MRNHIHLKGKGDGRRGGRIDFSRKKKTKRKPRKNPKGIRAYLESKQEQ